MSRGTLALVALAAACTRPDAGLRPPFRWGGDAEGGAPFVEADPDNPSLLRGFDVNSRRRSRGD